MVSEYRRLLALLHGVAIADGPADGFDTARFDDCQVQRDAQADDGEHGNGGASDFSGVWRCEAVVRNTYVAPSGFSRDLACALGRLGEFAYPIDLIGDKAVSFFVHGVGVIR